MFGDVTSALRAKTLSGRLIAGIVAAAVLLFALSGYFWWSKVYQSPERVYWDMMSNSLQTSSVTRQLTQKTSQSTLDQTIVLTIGTQNAVQSVTTLQEGNITVKTENIATPTKDYIRYTSVKSDQKKADGKPLDFKSVLNRWAQNDAVNSSNTGQTQPPLLTEVMLGVAGGNLIPQANLPAKDRDDLIKLLHNTVIFDTNFSNVKKQHLNGRSVYTYDTQVQAVGYVGYQKEFAKKVGLKLLDNVQPNDYQGQPATKVELQVDAWSHQLVSIDYTGQGRHETFSAYGVAHPITVPVAKLTGPQLQQLVNKVE